MKLDNRLSLCAEFVRQGAKTADIGTDHAYLPVYLVQSGRTDFAVAADVRVGPLENARGNIAESGLENKIKTVLSDGLEKISPDEAEDIVEPVIYTVKYDMNGHGDSYTEEVEEGAYAVDWADSPEEEGYTFLGWFYDSDLTHMASVEDVVEIGARLAEEGAEGAHLQQDDDGGDAHDE